MDTAVRLRPPPRILITIEMMWIVRFFDWFIESKTATAIYAFMCLITFVYLCYDMLSTYSWELLPMVLTTAITTVIASFLFLDNVDLLP